MLEKIEIELRDETTGATEKWRLRLPAAFVRGLLTPTGKADKRGTRGA